MDIQKSYDVILVGSSLGIATILRELYARKIRKILLVTNIEGFSGIMPYGEVVAWRQLLPSLDIIFGGVEDLDENKKIISVQEREHHIKVNAVEADEATKRIAYKFLVMDELPSNVYFPGANPKFLSNATVVREFFTDTYSRMPSSPKREGVTFCIFGDADGSGKLFFDLRDRVLRVAEKNGHPLKNIAFIFVGDKEFATEKAFSKTVAGASPIHYIAEDDIKEISDKEIVTKRKKFDVDIVLALGHEPVVSSAGNHDAYQKALLVNGTYALPRVQNSLEIFRQANMTAEEIERLLWDLPNKKMKRSNAWNFIETGHRSGVLVYHDYRISGIFGLLFYRVILFMSFFIHFTPKVAWRLNQRQEK